MTAKNKREGLLEGGVTRRQFLKKSLATAGVAAGLSAGLGGIYHTREAKAAQNQITFCSWGGAYQREISLSRDSPRKGAALRRET